MSLVPDELEARQYLQWYFVDGLRPVRFIARIGGGLTDAPNVRCPHFRHANTALPHKLGAKTTVQIPSIFLPLVPLVVAATVRQD